MPDLESVENDSTAGVLSVQERFAIVPEWLLDADVSGIAIRALAVNTLNNGGDARSVGHRTDAATPALRRTPDDSSANVAAT